MPTRSSDTLYPEQFLHRVMWPSWSASFAVSLMVFECAVCDFLVRSELWEACFISFIKLFALLKGHNVSVDEGLNFFLSGLHALSNPSDV